MRVVGIELAPLPFLYSWLRAAGRQPRPLSARRLRKTDFSQFDLVFAYLSPAAMSGLWRKAAAEMRPDPCLQATNLLFWKDRRIIITPQSRISLYIWYF
jgi:hypothetical protein